MPASNTPLVQKKQVPFYNPDCMVEMDGEVARGFVVLLGGSVEGTTGKNNVPLPHPTEEQAKGNLNDNAKMLGFMALTQGNAIDACFGIRGMASATRSNGSPASKQVAKVKSVLTEVADENETVQQLAVVSYQMAFTAVYNFHQKCKSLNIFTKCFCYGRLKREFLEELKQIFQHLDEAVQAAP